MIRSGWNAERETARVGFIALAGGSPVLDWTANRFHSEELWPKLKMPGAGLEHLLQSRSDHSLKRPAAYATNRLCKPNAPSRLRGRLTSNRPLRLSEIARSRKAAQSAAIPRWRKPLNGFALRVQPQGACAGILAGPKQAISLTGNASGGKFNLFRQRLKPKPATRLDLKNAGPKKIRHRGKELFSARVWINPELRKMGDDDRREWSQ